MLFQLIFSFFFLQCGSLSYPWVREVGLTTQEWMVDLKIDSNDDFIIFGENIGGTGEEYFVGKFQPNGTNLWSRSVGFSISLNTNGMTVLDDDRIVIFICANNLLSAFFTISPNGEMIGGLIKFGEMPIIDITNTPDGGFALAGHNNFMGYYKPCIFKFNSSLLLDWSQCLATQSASFDEKSVAITLDSNDYFVLVGFRGLNMKAFVVSLFTQGGSLIWTNSYDSSLNVEPQGVCSFSDGTGFVVFGVDLDDYFWLVKVDLLGNIDWEKRLVDSSVDNPWFSYCIPGNNDDNFFMVVNGNEVGRRTSLVNGGRRVTANDNGVLVEGFSNGTVGKGAKYHQVRGLYALDIMKNDIDGRNDLIIGGMAFSPERYYVARTEYDTLVNCPITYTHVAPSFGINANAFTASIYSYFMTDMTPFTDLEERTEQYVDLFEDRTSSLYNERKLGCFSCHGSTDSTACNIPAGGLCVYNDVCLCNEHFDFYDPLECSITTCNDILSNETDIVCNELGDCDGFNDCSCDDDGYFGSDCQYTYCTGGDSEHPETVCNYGNGTCWPAYKCTCNEGYYGENCEVFTCGGLFSNDTSKSDIICSGVGTCVSSEICSCLYNLDPLSYCVGCADKWYGFGCNVTECDNIFSNETEKVCNFGNGTCTKPDYCECKEESRYAGKDCGEYCATGWYGYPYCDIPSCYGVLGNYTYPLSDPDGKSTCSGHGVCYSINECVCESDPSSEEYFYEGDECEIPRCFGLAASDDFVCSSRGDCIEKDDCQCFEDYYGAKCLARMKEPTFTNELQNRLEMTFFLYAGFFKGDKLNEFTNGTFDCSIVIANWEDFLRFNTSYCEFIFDEPIPNYVFSQTLLINIIDEEEIYGDWNEGNGFDDDLERRITDQEIAVNYGVPDNFTIVFISVTEPTIIVPMKIISFTIIHNKDDDLVQPHNNNNKASDESSLVWLAISFPLIFVFIILIIISSICCFCCFCVCFLICSIFCFFCGSICCCCFISQQRKKLSKFGELDNFDLLLEEQKLDKDTTHPKIKIKKELFEIEAKKIKLLSLIGDGGSSAVVYRADWMGKIVAFKSFKSRDICGNDVVYDEFEREATLMASISHPNIIQFFGCSLMDPRIGFVMEYCENGDISAFIAQQQKNEDIILLKDKIRFLIEISSGMAYLHSRKIIHRDLKCENVLLDSNFTCKIMDFGISRIFDATKQAKTKGIGTSIYISPEIVMGSSYNQKVDVYSFSILCHILYYENPFPYGNEIEYIEAKVSSNPYFRPQFQNNSIKKDRNIGVIPEWLKNIIVSSWDADATKRKSFQQINDYLTENLEKYEEEELIKLENKKNSESSDISQLNNDSKKPIFIYLKLKSQNPSKAEQFFLMKRTMDGLKEVVEEKYPSSKFQIKRILMSKTEEEIKIDEDVENLLESNCLIDVEEFDKRDLELEELNRVSVENIQRISMLMEEIKKLNNKASFGNDGYNISN